MIKRVFSRETYNGYHLVSLRGEGEDPSPIGLFKKSTKKDEHGFMITEDDQPKCPHPGRYMGGWDNWLYVYSDCQKCPWVYHTRENTYACLLHTKEKIIPAALVNQGR